jgi:hypothetical protein
MARRRAPATPEETITSPRVFTRDKGMRLWQELARSLRGSRTRMADAEDVELGRVKVVPPKHLTKNDANIKYLVPALPQRKSLVLNATNMVAENPAKINRQRPPKGGPTTEARAEETETALNALLDELFPHDEASGRVVQHGTFYMVAMLAEDVWDAGPGYSDFLTEAEWKNLPKKEQATYRKAPAPDDARDTYSRPQAQYWRDRDGRGIEDAEYGRRDPKQTRKAFEDALRDYRAQHPPFDIRCYSAFDCVHAEDARGLQVLVVRQLMTESEIIEGGYRGDWLKTQDGRDRLLCPTGFDRRLWGKGAHVYVYQFFLWIDSDPHYAVMIGGQETDRVTDDGDRVEAIVNLRDRWGFSRLPCGVYLGPHLQTDNPDDRPVPFMGPIGDMLVAFEGSLGAKNITAWRRGVSKYTTTPEAHVPVAAYFDATSSTLKQIDLDEDADIVTTYGPIGHLAPQEHSSDSRYVDQLYLSLIQDATPSSAASGGGDGAESGRQVALLHTYAQSANGQSREGLRKARQDAASFLLEWACCYMRVNEIPEIPIYANVEVEPQEGNDAEAKKTVLVRLREDWIGANYKVTAEYLPAPNPVLIEQEVSLYEKGVGSFEDVQRARGKTNPLRERIKSVNDLYWRSERGQMELAAIDARQRGDVERAKAYEAWLAKQAAPLAVGPDGKPIEYGPSAALDDMFQQPPQGGGGPTTAQAQLAGTIGAGRGAETQDMAATMGAPAGAGMASPNGAAPGMGMG